MPRLSKIGAAALAAFGWTSGSSVTADFLVVAGGGGGATAFGAGGGAGGYRTSVTGQSSGGGASAEAKLSLNPTLSYTVVVGAGGNGATASISGTNGSNSSISTITSVGGGTGGNQGAAGSTGGSGGAGGNQGGISAAAGAGTANQGFAGGTGSGSSSYGSGGGGGAGAIGGTGTTSACGAGGVGVSSPISGTSTFYAGGGGGGATAVFGITTPGNGGNGGGGKGADSTNSWVGYSGEANKGGGGGGGGYVSSWLNGGNGGSGVVIISYVGAQQFGGGVVTSSGGNTIHTFTTSGTLSPLSSLTASYLIVAGGAGGACLGGGGGAGGMLTGSGLTLDTNSIYAVTVGAGGAGGTNGVRPANGSISTFSMVNTAAAGGGGGGGNWNDSVDGQNGGSGGGGGNGTGTGLTGGTGTAGQGNNGGTVASSASPYYSGAGGGAGAAGSGSNAANNGGIGLQSSITGTATYYAGGGAGTGWATGGGTAGTGGAGGGGNATNNSTGISGTANTGGGGGASGYPGASVFPAGGAGGSGVVIISYPGSTQQMAGGTVTVAGGNVIHTFTSSGYLTPIVLVNNSLRFRSSASAYLNRTPTTAGNRRTYTWSGWVKRGSLGASRRNMISAGTWSGGNLISAIAFDDGTADTLYVFCDIYGSGNQWQLRTTQVFRDPAAWYHIVVAVDTTQATSSNRVKIYVNGTQVTAFSTATYPSLNFDNPINNTVVQQIGASTAGEYFDGYMTEVNLIDGQALTPNSFGTYNGLGVWQPIRYGGSYGTNGFYLPFNAGTSSFAGLFNGSSQYLSLTANSSLQFGTGDFTVEGWYYQNGTVNYGNIFSTTLSFGTTGGLRLSTGPNNNTFQVATGGSGLFNASVAFSASRWNHFAVVRSSGVTTLYQNGVSVGSASDSNSYTADTFVIGWVDGSGSSAYLLNGLLSNFRVVKGTAVYTANFTPSTSPLTAISGTSLLTLQNATIIDNSTNAFSITNNGTVTTGQTYPCSTALFNDQGPAGNNWTPNNISGQFGTTLDSMTDVPTLTSATVANYAVWNPLILARNFDSNPQTITNGNLVSQFTSNTTAGKFGGASTIGVSSGKWYCEIVVTEGGTYPTYTNFGITGDPMYNATVTNASLGQQDYSVAWYNANGNVYRNGSSLFSGSTQSAPYTAMIALDVDANKIYFGFNGTWINSANPAAGTGGFNILAVSSTPTGQYFISCFFASTGMQGSYTLNAGQQPFANTPPTGFNRLNTFNLTTPAIGATPATTANKYFDATLYAGNGSTNTITNSGAMQPDFVWMKDRTNAYFHGLYDSVRGTGTSKSLYSNSTDAEGTNSANQNLTSFNSNGFSLGSTSSTNAINASGDSYVGWQWRANGTAVTNTAGSINSSVSANTTAGFSIVTYTGNATNGATVGHGLGVTPSMIIIKVRNATARWVVYQKDVTTANNQFLELDTTAGVDTSGTNFWTISSINSTTFGLGTNGDTNGSTLNFVAYCFAPVAGYSAFGTYTGNGSTDGTFVYLGFRPRFIILKRTNPGVADAWIMMDTATQTYNVVGNFLQPSQPDEELYAVICDFLSNGFKLRETYTTINTSSGTYIYMAFAESPFKYANAR